MVSKQKFRYRLGQHVLWEKSFIDWATGKLAKKQYKVRIEQRKTSKYGAHLYQGDNGIWFDEVRVIRELKASEIKELKEEEA